MCDCLGLGGSPEHSAGWTAQLFSHLCFCNREKHTAPLGAMAKHQQFCFYGRVQSTLQGDPRAPLESDSFTSFSVLNTVSWSSFTEQPHLLRTPTIIHQEFLESENCLCHCICFSCMFGFLEFFCFDFFLKLGKYSQMIINFGVNHNHLSVSYMM